MVRIRLTRVGRTHDPHYRIVVVEQARKRDGGFIEILGRYQPTKTNDHKDINRDRALYWLSQGAQPTDTVRAVFRKLGIMKDHHEAKVAAKKALKK